MYWPEPVLSRAQLRRLDKHEYSAQSASVLDPCMQPWWNGVLSWVPLWVAPNLLTIFGLVVNVATAVLLMCHTPNATEPAPQWITFLCALGLFVYQTLDAIDGKQARRTGTSSPLGELFDHGCDSVSTVFVSVASACTVSLGHMPYVMLFQCFVASSLFYCAHWQTYVTGTMRFGAIDVTEGQFCFIGFLMLSSVLGPGIWDYNVFGYLPLRVIPTIFGTLAGGISLIKTLRLIVAGGAGKNGSTIAGTSILTPVVPLLAVLTPAVYVVFKSEERLYENNSILFIFTFGLILTKITNKLIVAHMSKSEMAYPDITYLVPLVFCVRYHTGLTLGLSEAFVLKLLCAYGRAPLQNYSSVSQRGDSWGHHPLPFGFKKRDYEKVSSIAVDIDDTDDEATTSHSDVESTRNSNNMSPVELHDEQEVPESGKIFTV